MGDPGLQDRRRSQIAAGNALEGGNKWIDLQLPLYIHLAHTLNIEGTMQLGYILLPKETDKVGESMAVWDAAMLESADEAAMDVVADILDHKFWPPKSPVYETDFAAICQEQAFRPRLEGRETIYVLDGGQAPRGPHHPGLQPAASPASTATASGDGPPPVHDQIDIERKRPK